MLLADLLPILQFIHDRQVIHRDIKPENIIRRRLASSSSSLTSGSHVLVDFGAAKYVTPTALMETGTRIGSAVYVAPEQVRGKAIYASDLYSLGVTCIHLMTNISPFELMDMDGKWIWRNFLVNTNFSPVLARILDRLIASAPSQRYQNAQSVLNDLNNLTSTTHKTYTPRLANPSNYKAIAKTNITPIAKPTAQTSQAIAPNYHNFPLRRRS